MKVQTHWATPMKALVDQKHDVPPGNAPNNVPTIGIATEDSYYKCSINSTLCLICLCSILMHFVLHITDADTLTLAGEAARRRRSQSRSRRNSHSHEDPNIAACYKSEDQVIDTKIIRYMVSVTCAK